MATEETIREMLDKVIADAGGKWITLPQSADVFPSARDYFAAQETSQPPSWFRPAGCPQVGSRPDPRQVCSPISEQRAKMLEEWARDPNYDLDIPEFGRFKEAMDIWWKIKANTDQIAEVQRVAQWRYHMADAMLKARESK